MKKTVRLAIVGIPVISRPTQAWRERATFKIRGKKPKVSKDKLFECFSPKATDWLRHELVSSLKESPALLQRDIVVEVTDLGEVMLEPEETFEGHFGLHEKGLVELAHEFAGACSDFDAVFAVGGDHAGGLVFYGLPGRVARFDQHSDACSTPDTCGDDEVTRNNYVCASIRNGIKAADEIVGLGVREGEAPYKIEPSTNNADLIDVDIDVFDEKHGFTAEYNKGRLSPDDVIGAIRKCKPRAVGFFESAKGDVRAAELAVQLAEELVAAAARR
ncbi:hypothetical protein AUJ14_03405 [Candidatus Micrarchaeota archaeon CG1_02_55_22]|nr:MAG: hypothetical protein AUJ14_03405 [Candidatus Micrarchaeota archaeon CG1_02_55_22]